MAVASWKLLLIDWDTTVQLYGYSDYSDLNLKSKVAVRCEDCHLPNLLTSIESMRVKTTQRRNGQTEYHPVCKSCQQKRTWQKPGFRENQSATQSAVMRDLWKNEEYRENQSEKHKQSSASKWEDPEYRAKVSESIANIHETKPGYTQAATTQLRCNAERRIESIRNKYKSDNNYKNRISKSIKEWRSKTDIINKFKEIQGSDEYKKKLSSKAKKLWQDPTYASKIANNHSSSLEELFAGILDDLEIEYVRQFHIGHWSFDFMVPMEDKSILIEINGEYWHSSKFGARHRDSAKATYVEKYHSDKYKLHVIWEHELKLPAKISAVIDDLFGDNHREVIDFEFGDCVVKAIDPQSANFLLTKYHYTASGGRNGLNIGVYLGDELIGCCKFCGPTRAQSADRLGFKQSEILELTRFVISPRYQKKNFASWILSKSVRLAKRLKPKCKCLLSFADESYGHLGTIYRASGWKHDGIVAPDYHYLSPDGFVMHKRTLWGQAVKMCMSEHEYARKHGYIVRWGRQKHRYVKFIS